MKYIDLCGNKVSQIGLGTATIGPRENAKETLNEAYSRGINYIDTAHGYYDGNMEKYIGEWLIYIPRDSIYIATKRSICEDIFYPNKIINQVKMQCDIMNCSYIDYFLLHELDGYFAKNQYEYVLNDKILFDSLNVLKESGLVKNIGFSYSGETKYFKKIFHSYNWDFVQVRHNIIDQYYHKIMYHEEYTPYEYIMEYNKENNSNIGIIVMEAFEKSLLYDLKYAENDIPSQYINMKYLEKDNNLILLGCTDNMELIDSERLFHSVLIEDFKLDESQLNGHIRDIISYIINKSKYQCIYCYNCEDTCKKHYHIWYLKRLINDIYLKNNDKKYRKYLNSNTLCCDCNECTSSCIFGDNVKEFIDLFKNGSFLEKSSY